MGSKDCKGPQKTNCPFVDLHLEVLNLEMLPFIKLQSFY